MIRVGLLLLLLATAAAAQDDRIPLDERILTGLSQSGVSITATFSGEEILVYGAVERNRFLTAEEMPPGVILIAQGPDKPTLIRQQERTFGIWINRHARAFPAVPSFYAVSTSAPLEEMLDAREIDLHDIGLRQSLIEPEAGRSKIWHNAVVRLMRDADLYRQLPGNVRLIGSSLFESRIRLPANIFEGDYRIHLLLVRDREVVDRHTLILPVRRTGIGYWIYRLAQDEPLAYGLLSILVAAFAGWLASETFRRFRA